MGIQPRNTFVRLRHIRVLYPVGGNLRQDFCCKLFVAECLQRGERR